MRNFVWMKFLQFILNLLNAHISIICYDRTSVWIIMKKYKISGQFIILVYWESLIDKIQFFAERKRSESIFIDLNVMILFQFTFYICVKRRRFQVKRKQKIKFLFWFVNIFHCTRNCCRGWWILLTKTLKPFA